MSGEQTKQGDVLTSKTVAETLNTMAERFASGNSIPVERAHIKHDEWDAVVTERDKLVAALNRLCPHRGDMPAGMYETPCPRCLSDETTPVPAGRRYRWSAEGMILDDTGPWASGEMVRRAVEPRETSACPDPWKIGFLAAANIMDQEDGRGPASVRKQAKEYREQLCLPKEPSPVITPVEQLLVEWWSTDMDNAELFNRAVRLSPALATAMDALPEKAPGEQS